LEGDAPPPASDGAVLRLFEPGSYDLIPHDTMRRTIARRLVEAKSTIPHFYLTVDCELDALLALRAQLNAAAPVKQTDKGEVPAYRFSVSDMIIKALAQWSGTGVATSPADAPAPDAPIPAPSPG